MHSANKYRELFRAATHAALIHARAAKSLTHPGVKGEIVEILVRDLFRPLLPADVGVATGQIVECYSGRLSRQHDVILFDKSILPPILYEGAKGLIPIESVLHTIEVKTTLTAEGLRDAHEAAKQLLTFSYLPGQRDAQGRERHHAIEKARSAVFALDSDLSGGGMSEAERYRSIYRGDAPVLGAICVANREYWWEMHGAWIKIPGNERNDEILGFVAGVSNTYKWVALNRGLPNLGNYLMKEPDELIFIPSGTRPVVHLTCDGCGKRALLSLPPGHPPSQAYENGFRSDDRCKCGGNLVAPPGLYEYHDGLLVLAEELKS